MEKLEKLNELVEILSRDLGEIHAGSAVDAHWPFSMNYLGGFCIEEVLEVLIEMTKAQTNLKSPFPSIISQYFYFLFGSKKFVDLQTRQDLAIFLSENILKYKENSNYFNSKQFHYDLERFDNYSIKVMNCSYNDCKIDSNTGFIKHFISPFRSSWQQIYNKSNS